MDCAEQMSRHKMFPGELSTGFGEFTKSERGEKLEISRCLCYHSVGIKVIHSMLQPTAVQVVGLHKQWGGCVCLYTALFKSARNGHTSKAKERICDGNEGTMGTGLCPDGIGNEPHRVYDVDRQ